MLASLVNFHALLTAIIEANESNFRYFTAFSLYLVVKFQTAS